MELHDCERHRPGAVGALDPGHAFGLLAEQLVRVVPRSLDDLRDVRARGTALRPLALLCVVFGVVGGLFRTGLFVACGRIGLHVLFLFILLVLFFIAGAPSGCLGWRLVGFGLLHWLTLIVVHRRRRRLGIDGVVGLSALGRVTTRVRRVRARASVEKGLPGADERSGESRSSGRARGTFHSCQRLGLVAAVLLGRALLFL